MVDRGVSQETLEELLKEHLESDIICRIAENTGANSAQAMAMYYRSALSRQIGEGTYGLQYLDAGYLVNDLLENEPEIFLQDA